MKIKQWEVVGNLEVENLRWIPRVWRESLPLEKKILANKHSACCFSHDVLKKKILDHLFTSFYLHEGKQNTPPSVRVPACLPGWLEGSCLWHFRLPKAWQGPARKGKFLFPPFLWVSAWVVSLTTFQDAVYHLHCSGISGSLGAKLTELPCIHSGSPLHCDNIGRI